MYRYMNRRFLISRISCIIQEQPEQRICVIYSFSYSQLNIFVHISGKCNEIIHFAMVREGERKKSYLFNCLSGISVNFTVRLLLSYRFLNVLCSRGRFTCIILLGDSFYNTRKKYMKEEEVIIKSRTHFYFTRSFICFDDRVSLQLFIFTCYFSYRCVIFTYFHALKSQCYICLSCTYYNVSTNIIFSHLSKAQASRLTCINRCKDLSLNPINNNLIVLN